MTLSFLVLCAVCVIMRWVQSVQWTCHISTLMACTFPVLQLHAVCAAAARSVCLVLSLVKAVQFLTLYLATAGCKVVAHCLLQLLL